MKGSQRTHIHKLEWRLSNETPFVDGLRMAFTILVNLGLNVGN